jgi:hypothetical protein
MITDEMKNWLDSNNTEDYKKVFVAPIDSTEGTARRMANPVTIQDSALDGYRRRELIDNFAAAFSITITEAVQGIGEWQKNEK